MKTLHLVLKALIVFFFVGMISQKVDGQSEKSSILFIYDASGSMWGQMDGKTKKEIAADILTNTVTGLKDDQQIGFMAYGHRRKSDCEDVEFMIDLENTDKAKVTKAVSSINPLGKTPLANSAKQAISSIESSGIKTTIILITDGIESCNGNLCEVIRLAREKGIDFKLHIVGFGLKDGEAEALKCAAKEGNGNYYDAEDSDQLEQVLDDAVNQKIDDPEPNYTFYTEKNDEPIDAWIKVVEKESGKEIRGVRTYQDTAGMFLENGTYLLTINPLEGTKIASKTMELVKTDNGPTHSTISFDGGTIGVMVTNNSEGWDATIRVYDPITNKSVATKRTYGRKSNIEVNSGTYHVEILCLAMKGAALKNTIENVVVNAKETTEIAHEYDSGDLIIGVQTSAGELVDASVRVVDKVNNEAVAGTRTYTSESSNPKTIKIQPGTYEVSIKSLGKHKGSSDSVTLTVKKGETSSKTFIIN